MRGESLETLANILVQKMGICADGSRTWVFENLGVREIVPETELLLKTLGNGVRLVESVKTRCVGLISGKQLLAEIGAGYCNSAREVLYSS